MGLLATLFAVAIAGAPPVPTPPPPAPPGAAPAAPAPTAPGHDDGTLRLEGATLADAAPFRALVEPYLQVRSAAVTSLSDDGRRMLVSTRFGDTSQVHRVDMPGGARTQLTFSREPTRGGFVPGSLDVVFSRDLGGDENYQLYRLPAEGGVPVRITDGEGRVDGSSFSRDGTRLVYASTARNGRDLDLWIADGKDASTARILRELEGDWSPGAWSRDGRRLLVQSFVSVTDTEWWVLDVDGGGFRRLGAEGPASFEGAALFDADGGRVFVVSDRGGEHHALWEVDVATGAWTLRFGRDDGEVEAIALSPDGRTLALTSNERGWSALRLLDTRTWKARDVALPHAAVVSGLAWPERSRALAVTLSGPTTPGDAWTFEPRRAAWTRWTHSETGGLDPATFTDASTITFPSFDGRSIPSLYYRPAGVGPHPVVIVIHGGPEGQSRPGFVPFVQALTRMGVAVLLPDVRGSTGYGRTYTSLDNGRLRQDSVKDIGALLDWIGTQKDLDPARVGVTGASYGGFMVLASLTSFPERIRAGVDSVGIANFVSFLERTSPYRQDLRRAEYGDERDAEMRAFLTDISPVNRVDRLRSALFVAHGANDPRVPVGEAEQIVAAARKNGQDVWFLLARNEGHGFRKLPNQQTFQALQLAFLARHLGVTPPAAPD